MTFITKSKQVPDLLDELKVYREEKLLVHLEQMNKKEYYLQINDNSYRLHLTKDGLKIVQK